MLSDNVIAFPLAAIFGLVSLEVVRSSERDLTVWTCDGLAIRVRQFAVLREVLPANEPLFT